MAKSVVIRQKINSILSLEIFPFDIYNKADDRIAIKKFVSKIFEVGDPIFFYFRRIENITDNRELKDIKVRIMDYFDKNGKYVYLKKIDEKRFDSIGMLIYDNDIPGLMIDMWKYFYACDFFKPAATCSFINYSEYLKNNGFDDIGGIKVLLSGITDIITIKGLGGDSMYVSFINTPPIYEMISKSFISP